MFRCGWIVLSSWLGSAQQTCSTEAQPAASCQENHLLQKTGVLTKVHQHDKEPSSAASPSSPASGKQGVDAEVVLADAGNTCPNDYSKITSYRACLAALDVLGPGGAEDGGVPKAMPGYDLVDNGPEEDASDWPSGCYHHDNGVWFNTASPGEANDGAAPICARGLEPLAAGQVLFMGDSDVDYWATARGLSPGSHNVGVGGYTCVDVLGQVDGMLQAFAPSVLVLVCGENDIQGDDATAQAAFSAFSEIVSKVTATGARVITMSTKNEPSTSEYHATHAVYDGLVKGLARSLDGPLTVVDVNTGFQALGYPISIFASDELHLSTEGYSYWDNWVTLALEDSTCLVWKSGECAPPGEQGGDGDGYYYGEGSDNADGDGGNDHDYYGEGGYYYGEGGYYYGEGGDYYGEGGDYYGEGGDYYGETGGEGDDHYEYYDYYDYN